MKNPEKYSAEFPDGHHFTLWCGHSEGNRPNKTFEDFGDGKGALVCLSVLFLLAILHSYCCVEITM